MPRQKASKSADKGHAHANARSSASGRTAVAPKLDRLRALVDQSPRLDGLRVMQHKAQKGGGPSRPVSGTPHVTGLPTALQRGIEQLSGVPMDGVRVYRNSPEPATLNALAFARGRDIHLGPGQERLLPHEAWHVAQQAQGRVRPMAQTPAGPVNTDPKLEREADEMGRRAMSGANGPVMNDAVGPESGDVIQFLTMPSAEARGAYGTIDKKARERLGDVSVTTPLALTDDKKQANWIAICDYFEDLLTAVKTDLDENRPKQDKVDDFIDYVNAFSAEVTQIDQLYLYEVEQFKKSMTSYSYVEFLNTLKGFYTDIRDHYALMQDFSGIAEYDGHPGAKSRALAAGDAIKTDMAGKSVGRNYERDDSYTQDLGLKPGYVQKSKSLMNASEDLKPIAGLDRNKVIAAVRGAPAPESSSHTWTGAQRLQGKDRGKGQLSAMNGVSANQYAWATKQTNWEKHRWEWLHIRAASLGGATDGTNLVLGTRDANTHMMPFENQIKFWARNRAEWFGSTSKLEAEFRSSGASRSYSHVVSRITLKWKLSVDGLKPYEKKADFDPLHTGSPLTKEEVGIIEQTLKDWREERREAYENRKQPPAPGPPRRGVKAGVLAMGEKGRTNRRDSQSAQARSKRRESFEVARNTPG